jgi:hypothetical protein
MLHAGFSRHQAPSNFFFFGYLRKNLSDLGIVDLQTLKCSMGHIFVEIRQATCTTAFEIWIKRAKWAVKHKDEHLYN